MKSSKNQPKTVEEAVDQLINTLSEEDKEYIARLDILRVSGFHFGLGTYIRNNFLSDNSDLLRSCHETGGNVYYDLDFDFVLVNRDRASRVILEALWRKLRKNRHFFDEEFFLDEILYMESKEGFWFYDLEEIDPDKVKKINPMKAIFYTGKNSQISDDLEIILKSNQFTGSDEKVYKISDEPGKFFSEYLPRKFNFSSQIKSLIPINPYSERSKKFLNIMKDIKKYFKISDVPLPDFKFFEIPNRNLIGSRNALKKLYLSEEDIQKFLYNDSPENYFLMGFWGHGMNTHAFYYIRTDPKFKIYFRLPFGNLYNNKKEIEIIGNFLNDFFDFRRNIGTSIKELKVLEAFNKGLYEITREDGNKSSYKKSLFTDKLKKVWFNEFITQTNLKYTKTFKIPTKKNIEALLEFIPYFSDSSNKFYEVSGGKKENGTFTFPFYSYVGEADRFYHSTYHENFVQGFEWSKWQKEPIKIYKNPELLADADILTIVKYITIIMRKERFAEGFIASMIDNGFILKMLLRLKEIYELEQF